MRGGGGIFYNLKRYYFCNPETIIYQLETKVIDNKLKKR